jgi:hypothetical protein
MHRQGVEVFTGGGLKTSVDGRDISVDNGDEVPKENPSARRGAIKLEFDCEQCDMDRGLVISQHKGNEFIYWE